MLKDIITADQLSLVISQAAAPAFLLGAVASFLSVLVMHMSRILDRSRAINDISGDDPKTRELKVQLPELRLRAVLVIRAIYWAVGSGITTCLLMIVAFASAYIGARHEPAAARFRVGLRQGEMTGAPCRSGRVSPRDPTLRGRCEILGLVKNSTQPCMSTIASVNGAPV